MPSLEEIDKRKQQDVDYLRRKAAGLRQKASQESTLPERDRLEDQAFDLECEADRLGADL